MCRQTSLANFTLHLETQHSAQAAHPSRQAFGLPQDEDEYAVNPHFDIPNPHPEEDRQVRLEGWAAKN